METITEKSPKKKDKYLVDALLVAVAFSLISLLILANKLEIMETNYDVLTREVRLLEQKRYDEMEKDVRLLEEARDFLQECKEKQEAKS